MCVRNTTDPSALIQSLFPNDRWCAVPDLLTIAGDITAPATVGRIVKGGTETPSRPRYTRRTA